MAEQKKVPVTVAGQSFFLKTFPLSSAFLVFRSVPVPRLHTDLLLSPVHQADSGGHKQDGYKVLPFKFFFQ